MLLLANAGVPMCLLIGPAMLFLIVPVILLEWAIGLRMFKNISKKSLLGIVATANLATTVIGWPLLYVAWLLLDVILGIPGMGDGIGIDWGKVNIPGAFLSATLGAPWLLPYEDDLWWMMPTATICFLIPCFFLSVWIEGWLCQKMLRGEPTRRFAWIAHLASYGLLVVVTAASTLYFYKMHVEYTKEIENRTHHRPVEQPAIRQRNPQQRPPNISLQTPIALTLDGENVGGQVMQK